MTLVSLRTLVTATAQVGEGPAWVDSVQQLLWVDIHLGQIHSSGGLLPGPGGEVGAPLLVQLAARAVRRAGVLVGAEIRFGVSCRPGRQPVVRGTWRWPEAGTAA